MASRRIFGMVLAGGEGKRLMPLTEDRAKPAVPFGGSYRLIDFALSNLINSGVRRIVVLTQYKSHSLDRHISQTWRMSPLLGSYVASVPAQQRLGKRWFSGSADAILQSMNLLSDETPDYIIVVGADHVYRMDFDQMIEAHIASGKGVTVAAIRQPMSLANQFGVIEVDEKDPAKIAAFKEKPSDPRGLPDSPNEVLASMGNYVFTAQALIDDVRRRHPGEALTCPYMRALDAALASHPPEERKIGLSIRALKSAEYRSDWESYSTSQGDGSATLGDHFKHQQ